MTFCKVCGKLLPNVRFDPKETVICQNCADRMKEDLVRVVRCKDCINSGLETSGIGYWCSAHIEWHDAEWFCADGKRNKEN